MAKLFEKIDDNPGDYFGMLVESVEDKKEYSSGNYFLTVDETGMGPHYSLYYQHPHSGYDGFMFIVDGYGYDNFKEKLSEFSTIYPNKDVQNLLKSINENKSVSINDKSLKEDSEYKTLAKLSNGLEVISYPYGYAVSDGYAADRFVVRDGKYIFDDGRFRLSDKDKEKILSLIKKGVIEESLKESRTVDYLELDLAEKSGDEDVYNAYDENELTIVKDGNVWYFEHCPYGLDKKVKKLMKKYYPELNYLYDESLKEDYYDKRLVQKLYSMWFSKEQAEWLAKNAKDYAESLAYGHTTTDDLIEAEEYVNSKMKKQEAIKEDKFVSRDKMSKKDKKELDSKKRNTWGNTNPVTRVQPNKKAYDRKRDKKELAESTFENALKAKDGKIFMDTVGEKLIVLGNGMQHLSGNERIKFDDIVYYYKLLEDAYKAYGDYLKNSSSLKLRPWNYEDTTWNYPDEMY